MPGRTPRFPWSWTLPAIVVIVLTIVVGIVRYPGLPARIPVHFDIRGAADRTAPATVWNAFFPVVVQILLTAVLAGCAALTLRAPGRGRGAPDLTARSLLVLAACLDLADFFFAAQMWRAVDRLGAAALASSLTVAGIGLVVVVVTVIRVGRRPREGPEEVDLDHWRGFVYVNRDDPKLFVPKRYGIGWTFNFGRPASWVFLGVLLALVILAPILGALTS